MNNEPPEWYGPKMDALLEQYSDSLERIMTIVKESPFFEENEFNVEELIRARTIVEDTQKGERCSESEIAVATAKLQAIAQLYPLIENSKRIEKELELLNSENMIVPSMVLGESFGWPPPLRLPTGYSRVILERANGIESEIDQREQIDREIVNFYTAKALEGCYEEWVQHPILVDDLRRVHIIRKALDAHLSGDYACSVPTLLPQCEGLFMEGVFNKLHVGRDSVMREAHYKKMIKQLKSADKTGLIIGLAEATLEFVSHHALAQSKEKGFINRHAILHGGDTGYWEKEVNSVKCFVWLDDILLFITEIQRFNTLSS